jgi:hypothetical protein
MRESMLRVPLFPAALLIACGIFGAQQAEYRVKPVLPPPLKRPAVKALRENLPKGATGILPTFDGEQFHINLPGGQPRMSEEAARQMIGEISKAVGWERNPEELRLISREPSRVPEAKAVDQQARQAIEETKKQVSGRLGPLDETTQKSIEQRSNEAKAEMMRAQEVVSYDQRFQGTRIELARIQAIYQQGRGLVAVTGRLFSDVRPSNRSALTEAQGIAAARAYVSRYTKLAAAQAGGSELVILPYGDTMKFAWRVDVAAEEGPYRLWLDAESRTVLQLEPLFSAVAASGLIFNRNPPTTEVRSFEVNPASGGNYTLTMTNLIALHNSGADGTGGDLTLAAPAGSTSAHFNVAPINGTVVERTNQTNYNGRFQEVSAYAWIYGDLKNIEGWGGRTFPSTITVRVNHNNPCGFGINNSCANWGSNTLVFGIGQATISTSTSTNDLFSGALDATVLAHELGHLVNHRQMSPNSPSWTLDEGLADFWAATITNTDIFGGWWAHNSSTPVQTGFVPRQAESQDVFPEHRGGGNAESHADGQIINWALWSTRTGLNSQTSLGSLLINMNLLKALTTAGGVSNSGTDQAVHDSFLNLLQQMMLQFTGSNANKLLAGFARAGICLSERDAVIDIDDDYLARSSTTGPTFTVFGGRDYQFNASQGAVSGNFFNTRFQVEVANDANFASNCVLGPWMTTIAAVGGVPRATWTLPAGDWNTVKAGAELFYRVTTSNAKGGDSRVSTSPGNGAFTVPAPAATINESGQCEQPQCSVASASGSVPWILLVPLLVAYLWRRHIADKATT